MIFKNGTVGKHINVTLLEFGKGDIDVAPAITNGKPNSLVFYARPESEIGTTTNNVGKTTDEVGIDVMFVFEKPESIDVIVKQLKAVKNNMLNHK